MKTTSVDQALLSAALNDLGELTDACRRLEKENGWLRTLTEKQNSRIAELVADNERLRETLRIAESFLDNDLSALASETIQKAMKK